VDLTDELRGLTTRLFSFLAPGRHEREAVLAQPLPEPLQRLLAQRFKHYRRLPAEVRAEFNRQLQVFLAEKPVTPVKARVTGEIRLLAAASAVTLTAGWPGYTWDQLSEVLIYPKGFDEDYRFHEANRVDDGRGRRYRSHLAGQAHPWGVVILSKPALTQSFAGATEGQHVGLHEFAHLLDLARSEFDGVPSYLDDGAVQEWKTLLAKEQERLSHGDSFRGRVRWPPRIASCTRSWLATSGRIRPRGAPPRADGSGPEYPSERRRAMRRRGPTGSARGASGPR
jgi:Mlc titration factor MtfA (ptsG expression regulator)